jgi:hypothetical protein
MSQTQGQPSVASQHRGSNRAPEVEGIDPLLFYESGGVGREFDAIIPGLNDPRSHETRRSEILLKTWQGVPSMKDDSSTAIRHGLSGARDFEYKNVANSERMIIIILTVMTVITGLIFAAFMASM